MMMVMKDSNTLKAVVFGTGATNRPVNGCGIETLFWIW
jgi:hypothetical protein